MGLLGCICGAALHLNSTPPGRTEGGRANPQPFHNLECKEGGKERGKQRKIQIPSRTQQSGAGTGMNRRDAEVGVGHGVGGAEPLLSFLSLMQFT